MTAFRDPALAPQPYASPGLAEVEPVIVPLLQPDSDGDQFPLPREGVAQGDERPFLLPARPGLEADRVEDDPEQLYFREVVRRRPGNGAQLAAQLGFGVMSLRRGTSLACSWRPWQWTEKRRSSDSWVATAAFA